MNTATNSTSSELAPIQGVPVVVADELAWVRQVTQSLFASAVEVEIDSDPEEPGESWWNLRVASALTARELSELLERWHETIYQLPVRDATRYRVLVRQP